MQEEGRLEERVAGQKHRNKKTSNGIVETEDRKLVVIKMMVRTKLTVILSLCFAAPKRDIGVGISA